MRQVVRDNADKKRRKLPVGKNIVVIIATAAAAARKVNKKTMQQHAPQPEERSQPGSASARGRDESVVVGHGAPVCFYTSPPPARLLWRRKSADGRDCD
jgi:hypothetical protein